METSGSPSGAGSPAQTASDPAAARLYRNACREAWFVVVVWAAALVWTVGWCYLFGYQHTAESWVVRLGLASVRPPGAIRQYGGLPDWVLFGIVVPWLICTAITMWFALWGMSDDDLGTEAAETNDPPTH